MKRKTISLVVLFVLLVSSQSVSATEDYPPIPSGSEACTSFGLNHDGALVFGTNFDNTMYEGLIFINKQNTAKTGWETSPEGNVASWVSKYGSVTFNLAGYQMAWAGMNEAGLVLSTMALDETQIPAPDERPPLVSPFWMQYQLDNFSTIDEVIASDSTVRMADTVDHYLVCDKTAACAVIEFLDGEMLVHTGDDLPVNALTNNTYDDSLATWEAGDSAPSDNSLRRFYSAAKRVMDYDGKEPPVDYAFETLKTVSQMGGTQWSIVFDTQNQRAYFRTLRNTDIRYIDLSTFDLSCSTPTLMINIHEDLSGDISSNFVEYDHDVSLAHTSHFLEQWSQGAVSEAEAMALMMLFESYSCNE